MNEKILLAKAISLLFRESQVGDEADRSLDLVHNVINSIKVGEVGIGISGDREIIVSLKSTVLDMCTSPKADGYDLNVLLQRVKIATANDDKLYKAISQGIEPELSEKALKKTILSLRRSISNYFRENVIKETVGKAHHKLRFDREAIPDINTFLDEFIAQLEPLRMETEAVDPAMVADIDIGNETSLRTVFEAVKAANTGTGLYKLGKNKLNDMFQGGLRPGEFVIINALQHKYKTGMSLSIFADLAIFNAPLNTDPTKKPLLVRYSFEDEITDNLQFIYQYLKYSETREYVDVKSVDIDEMTQYVKSRMGATGFHIKMKRVDPTQWTHRDLFNDILKLEAQGYVVEAVVCDYLAKMPTTGCVSTGPIGSDRRDQFRRTRNFMSSRKILFISPHQISSDAKMLLRGGMAEDQFVKELAGRGFTDGCRVLDQEWDCAVYMHLFKYNKETYLAIQRDKHRIPTIINNEDDLYCIYKFPKRSPLPYDLPGEDASFRKLSAAPSNAPSNTYDI